MLKNYIIIALRNMNNFRTSSIINIIGLSIGITSAILLFLFIQFEDSYDKFHTDYEDIYRIIKEVKYGEDGNWIKRANSGMIVKELVSIDFPEIENITRIASLKLEYKIKYNGKVFKESEVIYAEPNFFDIFSFKLIEGNKKTVLSSPQSVIISEKIKSKYFGDVISTSSVIGNYIELDKTEYKIVGVLKNIPKNSSLRADFIFSFERANNTIDKESIDSRVWTYYKESKTNKLSHFQGRLSSTISDKIPKSFTDIRFIHQNIAEIHKTKCDVELSMKIDDIPVFKKLSLFLFSIIAMLTLLISFLNFTNMNIARSTTRGKEVGIRMTYGATKKDIFLQFVVENIVTIFISIITSLISVELFLPEFNNLFAVALELDFFGENFKYFLLLILFSTIIAIISSYLPSRMLTTSGVLNSLKKSNTRGKKGQIFRKALIVTQFSLSFFLIIITMSLFNIINSYLNLDLGFKKENIITFNIAEDTDIKNKFPIIKEEFSNITGVNSITTTSFLPGVGHENGINFRMNDGENKIEDSSCRIVYCNSDFLKTLEITPNKGTGFVSLKRSVTPINEQILVNQGFIDKHKIKDPIGKKIELFYNSNAKNTTSVTIVGVIPNIATRPAIESSKFSTIFRYSKRIRSPFHCLINIERNPGNTISLLQKKWEQIFPEKPFYYTLLEDEINSFYSPFNKLLSIFTIYSLLTILVSAIGQYGLTLFTVKEKSKMIGVKKVFGASVSTIIMSILFEYIKPIFLSFIIVIPISIYILDNVNGYLTNVTAINYFVFFIAFFGVMLLTFIIVIFQTYKLSQTNPVETLKYE